MSKIIFLNGSSSVGKTSIAKEIMNQSNDLWLFFSIDFLVNEWVDKKFICIDSEEHEEWQKNWFFHKRSSYDGMPLTIAADGSDAQELHRDVIDSITLLSKKGRDIIIDEVLMTKDAFKYYAKNLKEFAVVYLIAVRCDLFEAEKREQQRGDRWLGQSRGFLSAYDNVPFYDITVDTTHISPSVNARSILEFVSNNPAPEAFKKSLMELGS